MSYLQRVEKLSDSHYLLPKVAGMRVPVHAYLSESLFQQTDEALWRQAASAAGYPGMIGLYLMPDTHLGYGIPVGGVAVTEDVIIQAGSGYDISCGVVYLQVPELHAADVADRDKRRRWIEDVERRVATGIGSQRPRHMPKLGENEVEDILRHGARAIGVQADVCERQFIPVDESVLDTGRITRARSKASPQLGSVGGGNHFVEMQLQGSGRGPARAGTGRYRPGGALAVSGGQHQGRGVIEPWWQERVPAVQRLLQEPAVAPEAAPQEIHLVAQDSAAVDQSQVLGEVR